jgi:hypothetical protein
MLMNKKKSFFTSGKRPESNITIKPIDVELEKPFNGKDIYLLSHDSHLIGLVTEDVLTIQNYTREPVKQIVLNMLKETSGDAGYAIFAANENELKRKMERAKRKPKQKIFW